MSAQGRPKSECRSAQHEGTPVSALRHTLCVAWLALAGMARANALPPEVNLALQRARVPEEALSVVVRELGAERPLLALREQRPVNPASLTKLLTTYAALDQLGPAWSWTTPVWLQGAISAEGVLDGSLHIKGSGDPKLVVERLWLLLRRVQQAGVREIRGDIVLDNSAFSVSDGSPADFDGEGTRPYNARPAALLMNFSAVSYTFQPDSAAGVARVLVEPPLAGASIEQRTLPLAAGPCNDWRSALKASFDARVRFAGSYAAACGEQTWPVADLQPASYNARLVEGLWKEMGGRLGGSVREGPAPAGRPSFEISSPPLAEVIRDINKYSNNVMAQQLFYTLDLVRHPATPATAAGARQVLRQWLADKLGELPADWVIDNGSGLSRETRVSAQALARLLALAFDSPLMPELMASLPIAGVDGTLRRMRSAPGRAHLKTGSLRDVAAVGGYVVSDSGRRYVLVAVIQHPNANAARPALDALVQWTLRDAAGGASATATAPKAAR